MTGCDGQASARPVRGVPGRHRLERRRAHRALAEALGRGRRPGDLAPRRCRRPGPTRPSRRAGPGRRAGRAAGRVPGRRGRLRTSRGADRRPTPTARRGCSRPPATRGRPGTRHAPGRPVHLGAPCWPTTRCCWPTSTGSAAASRSTSARRPTRTGSSPRPPSRSRRTTRSGRWRWPWRPRSPAATASTAAHGSLPTPSTSTSRRRTRHAPDASSSSWSAPGTTSPGTAPRHSSAAAHAAQRPPSGRPTRSPTSTCSGTSANAALHLGDDDAHRRFYALMLSTARENGDGMAVLYALQRVPFSQYVGGQWAALRNSSEEAVALGLSVGQRRGDGRPAGVADTARRTRGSPRLRRTPHRPGGPGRPHTRPWASWPSRSRT